LSYFTVFDYAEHNYEDPVKIPEWHYPSLLADEFVEKSNGHFMQNFRVSGQNLNFYSPHYSQKKVSQESDVLQSYSS
jgi:hypothetical protein